MKRECETCIKRKTPYCPTSIECMATDDMPYYQNRIMLLEENEQLKKDIKNIIRILDNNCDDLEATEEEFESLDRWQNE